MEKYAIIVDNGGGPDLVYHDVVGEVYTFPKNYQTYLLPGTKVIYLRSGKNEKNARLERLMDEAHYFGSAEIGEVVPTTMNNLRATIVNYVQFSHPVLFNNNGEHYEKAEGKFWRNGVRVTTVDVYNAIIAASRFAPVIKPKKKVGDAGKRTKTALDYSIESMEFADGQFKIVTAIDGYYLFSLSDHVFYKLCGKKSIRMSLGSITIRTSIQNPNHFMVIHKQGSTEELIGDIDLINNGVNFGSLRLIKDSVKMMV